MLFGARQVVVAMFLQPWGQAPRLSSQRYYDGCLRTQTDFAAGRVSRRKRSLRKSPSSAFRRGFRMGVTPCPRKFAQE